MSKMGLRVKNIEVGNRIGEASKFRIYSGKTDSGEQVILKVAKTFEDGDILWTNRVGEPLETAVKWCEEHGLRLDAVNDNLPESVEFFGTNTRKIYADEFIDDRMVQGFNLPYYGEPKIKELTPEELFRLYQERYLDGRDPVINYRSHDTIPNAIVVEHHSGFESTFYTSIEMES